MDKTANLFGVAGELDFGPTPAYFCKIGWLEIEPGLCAGIYSCEIINVPDGSTIPQLRRITGDRPIAMQILTSYDSFDHNYRWTKKLMPLLSDRMKRFIMVQRSRHDVKYDVYQLR